MTTGQRVAQKRKELGLSQEALGEKLGVSRQSIYKWESDNALPEVEKLVALSRLFGVSVGWILGVEEDSAPAGGELTREQLNLVEEIAARYVPSPARLAVVKLSVAAAAVCLCAVLWGFHQRLGELTENYDRLEDSIAQVQSGVNGQIGLVSSRVEELLKSQNDVTADYGAELLTVDLERSSAMFHAYAVPKRFAEGMTAEFYAWSGTYQGRAFQAAEPEEQRFETDLSCGVREEITLTVTFCYPDGTRQTQVLERWEGLYGQMFPEVRADYPLVAKTVENGELTFADDVLGTLDTAQPPEPLFEKAELKRLRVGLFRNKRLVDWAVFHPVPGAVEADTTALTGEQWEALKEHGQSGGEKPVFSFREQSVPVEPEDVLQIAAVMEDVYGRTAIRSGPACIRDGDWGQLCILDAGGPDTYPAGWTYD